MIVDHALVARSRMSFRSAISATSLAVLVLELLALEAGQAAEAHVDDRLGLAVGQGELGAQRSVFASSRVRRAADDLDDLDRCCRRDPQTFDDVLALLRLAQQVARPAPDDVLAVVEVGVEQLAQRQRARLPLGRSPG